MAFVQVLVRYGWVDRYENINRQYVDCQAPENAYNHEKKLVDIMRFHYSAVSDYILTPTPRLRDVFGTPSFRSDLKFTCCAGYG